MAVGALGAGLAMAALSPAVASSPAAALPGMAPPPVYLAVGTACLLAFVTVVKSLRLTVVAIPLLLAGYLAGEARLQAVDHSELASAPGKSVKLIATVAAKPRGAGFRRYVRVHVRAALVGGGSWRHLEEGALVSLPAEKLRRREPNVGDEVKVEGAVRLPRNRPGDGFDWVAYLRRLGVRVEIWAESVRLTGGRRGGLVGVVDAVRNRTERALGAGLEPEVGALARGMVLGQDEAIPERMREEFRRSGLMHLLAVSGQNVVLLALLAIFMLAAVGLGLRARLVGVLVLIFLYVPMAGAGPSILRAGAMGAATTVAALAGRPSLRWYPLLLAATFTLALNPRAWQDVGWQLSFAAVVSILSFAGTLRRVLGRLPSPVGEGTAITVSATCGTAPLMAYHFGAFSVVSLVANLLALPVVGPIMWLGVLAGGVGQVWSLPAELLNVVNGFCLGYLAQIARWTAAAPNAVAEVSLPSVWSLAATYAALVVMALLLRAAARGWGVRWAVLGLLAVGGGIFMPGVLTRRASSDPPRGALVVTFLDVGQGDATLIQTPSGEAVLVDGGPSGDGLATKLAGAGVEGLDLVVLSHIQMDHIGGLREAVERYRVGTLLDGSRLAGIGRDGAEDGVHPVSGSAGGGGDSAGGGGDPAGDGGDPAGNGKGGDDGLAAATRSIYRAIVTGAEARGAKRVEAEAGQRIEVGDLIIRVLSPKRGKAGRSPAGDPNAYAVVLLASYGKLDVLLPADAESDVLSGLSLQDVEVLKVSHHGSRDPGLTAVLGRLQPEVAVIEVGARNRFGHPDPQTVADLRSTGARVYRTDRDGTVRVIEQNESLTVQTGRDRR